MKIVTWNVNGIRAAQRGGFLDWFERENADIVCLQETKAFPEQLDEGLRQPRGYHSFWNSAEKPGYSGVAVYSKKEPLSVRNGLGIAEFDREGRVVVADYGDFTLINSYFPNSQRDHARLDFKVAFCNAMLDYCQKLHSSGKHLVLCGDFNIAHAEIDLKNPKSNENNAGFLPEERAWMTELLQSGYIDTFRHFTKEGGHYTWWSYRPGVREKNIGWRLDYQVVNQEFADRLKRVEHQPHVKGSDHCPVALVLGV